jgi:hypothetical protein
MGKLLVAMCFCLGSPSVWGDEMAAAADRNGGDRKPVVSSHGLMAELQGFLRQQGVDANRLSADAMVRVMVDWYRFTSESKAEGAAAIGDALVYRYGGWSEGCATAFKLSLLRRVTEHHANEADTERFAGITLMFEPSGQAELMPFSVVSSDTRSIEAFLQTIESSPAFRELAGATPMGVLIEGGGLR